jgi:hypothetical protein
VYPKVTAPHRYLLYRTAYHQNQPEFFDTFPIWVKDVCDMGLATMMDLHTEKYYCNSVWLDTPVHRSYPGTPLFNPAVGTQGIAE